MVNSKRLEIDLSAAVVTVTQSMPIILTKVGDVNDEREYLPSGPFAPLRHRTLEIGLRAWVEAQTALKLGYVEQLYTFGDRGRHAESGDVEPHVMSVGYLALARRSEPSDTAISGQGAHWRSWYDFFPWEDWRKDRPELLDRIVLPALEEWSGKGPAQRRERLRIAFSPEQANWDEERVLDRYELMYEAGLVEEARRDGRAMTVETVEQGALGRAMRLDHRRILATAISRLRAKLRYKPLIFELMPDAFTLTELQQTAEAIAGRHLHKQNFRRFVEQTQIVEPTGATLAATGGRPAKLYRFRREVVAERAVVGLHLGRRL